MYRQVAASPTLLMNTLAKKLAAENKKIFKFGFGQSPFLPPQRVLKALQNATHYKAYSSVQGDAELRALMAQFHAQHNGLQVHPDDIFVAPGSKILLYNILLAFKQADVLIPAPAWVSYAPQATLAGHNIIRVTTTFEERWRVTPHALHAAANKKKHCATILILNYPGNPDGLGYTPQELQALAASAKTLNLLVISDEIYGLLNHTHTHHSFANYYPENTITTTGLSKWCGAGGWRFGAALLSPQIDSALKKALIGIGSETYSCAPLPVQVAAKSAYKHFDEMMYYVQRQIDILSTLGNYCVEQLQAQNIRVHKPDGGFYLFPDFSPYAPQLAQRGIHTSEQLCQSLLQETGVALLPALAFGFSPNYLAARLAYVDFLDPLPKNDFLLERDCPNVIAGIKALTTWLSHL